MNMDRRNFMKAGLASLFGGLVAKCLPKPPANNKPIAVADWPSKPLEDWERKLYAPTADRFAMYRRGDDGQYRKVSEHTAPSIVELTQFNDRLFMVDRDGKMWMAAAGVGKFELI